MHNILRPELTDGSIIENIFKLILLKFSILHNITKIPKDEIDNKSTLAQAIAYLAENKQQINPINDDLIHRRVCITDAHMSVN